MATRWFLSRVVTRTIGDEEKTELAIELVRKPDGSPWWPDGTGKRHAYIPAQGWGLSIVDVGLAGRATVPVPNDPDVFALPEHGLDTKVQAMHGPSRAAMTSWIQSLGVATDFIQAADGYREVIRHLGRIGKPDFDETTFGEF